MILKLESFLKLAVKISWS